LDTLVSQFDHTVGTNSFFVRLARDLRIQGGMLLRWLNASESTERFTYRGERRWLRPDGYAEFKLGGKLHSCYLEWDRGTTRNQKVLDEKFRSYANYFATQAEHPDLLVVTVAPARELVVWAAVNRAFSGSSTAQVLTSVDSHTEGLGPLAAGVWRSEDGTRRTWPANAALV
jgi:hypothetical protein